MRFPISCVSLLILLLLPLFCCASANAAISPTLNYQGRLTDPSGNPVADGSYDLVFRIYASASGGSPLWSSGASPVSVTVADGLFSVILGSGSMPPLPENVFTGLDLYLGVQLLGEAEFSPRQRVSATIYSLRANTAETAGDADLLGGIPPSGFLQKSGGTLSGPLAIDFDNDGDDITFTKDPSLGYRSIHLYWDNSKRFVADANESGGDFSLFDQNDHALVKSSADPDFGGILDLRRANGSWGIYMYGGGSPTNQTIFDLSTDGSSTFRIQASDAEPAPRMYFTHNTGTHQIEFYLGAATDGEKVHLTPNAIDAYEIGDEVISNRHVANGALSVTKLSDDAGGAQSAFSTNFVFFLNGGVQTIIQSNVNAPAAGYVLAIASFQITNSHTNGTASTEYFGLTDNPSVLPGDQTKQHSLASTMPTGSYKSVISLQRIIAVDFGSTTISLIGNKLSGANNPTITDATLSLIYFKTERGAID